MNNETRQIMSYSYSMERGILLLNPLDNEAKKADIFYDFDCKEYEELRKKYYLEKIAGKGSDYEKAKRLLKYFSAHLAHNSMYDNHVKQNALDLLEYSFDNPEHGINCLNKSKIFVEVCLSLKIKARRVWIMPYSPYDFDNHVVAEIYDSKSSKWIMMDPTSGGFFVDERNMPLSLLELRDAYANNKFVTLTFPGNKRDLKKQEEKMLEDNWYICKNVFRFIVTSYQGFGDIKDSVVYNFTPKDFSILDWERKNFLYRIDTYGEQYPEMKKQFEKDLKALDGEKELEKYSFSSIY